MSPPCRYVTEPRRPGLELDLPAGLPCSGRASEQVGCLGTGMYAECGAGTGRCRARRGAGELRDPRSVKRRP